MDWALNLIGQWLVDYFHNICATTVQHILQAGDYCRLEGLKMGKYLPPDSRHSSFQYRGHESDTVSISPRLMTYISTVFSNRALPSSCGEQIVALAIVWFVLEFPWSPLANNSIECYPITVLGVFSWWQEMSCWDSFCPIIWRIH